MIVLKLGGSVITNKNQPETIDETALKQAAAAIADTTEPIILIHGGGSFGHPYADRHGVTESTGTADAEAVREIHEAMRTLNQEVTGTLAAAGVPSVPVAPLSFASRDATGVLQFSRTQIQTFLEEGFLPVVHGDIIGHQSVGATILSGDELVVELTESLNPDRVGLCSTVPGVLDEEGNVIELITESADVPPSVSASEATDVTGGMAGKVSRLQTLSRPASVFGLDALDEFLAGESPGTTIR